MLSTKLGKYFSYFTAIVLISSCTPKVQLEKDEFLLRNLAFKGNKQISSDELETLIPPNQKPNRRFLDLDFMPAQRLSFYMLGKKLYNENKVSARFEELNRQLQSLPQDFSDKKNDKIRQKIRKKLERTQETFDKKIAWFWRFVGEEPSIIDINKIEKTKKDIELYVLRKGFYDRKISYSIDTTKRGFMKLTYQIEENKPYLITRVVYDAQDEKIDSLFKSDLKNTFTKLNSLADWNNIENEKLRLEALLKNNGYYNFSPQFFDNQMIDTFRVDNTAEIRFKIKYTPKQPKFNQYSISEIQFLAAEINSNQKLSSQTDTTLYNGINYIFVDNKFPIKLLDSRVGLRPNELYSLEKITNTKRQLYNLNQFSFANFQYRLLPDNKLRVEITAPTLLKYNVTVDPNLNLVNSIFGIGLNGSVKVRNQLKKLDIIELAGRLSHEGTGINNIRSTDIGGNASITFPQIMIPFLNSEKLRDYNPKTQLGVGLNNSNTLFYNRTNLKFTGVYSWQKSSVETFIFSFLDINLTNTSYSADSNGISFRKTLIEQQLQGNSLKVSFDPQFVSSISGSYVFNNQVQGDNKRAKYLRIFAESGGTLLGLIKDPSVNYDRVKFIDKLFPVKNQVVGELPPDTTRAYFRFLKFNIDFRKYLPISSRSSWAYRFNIGLAIPYGKNRSLPYEKNFFAGGSTSVRAWDPRGLGTGSAKPQIFENFSNRLQTLPQPGDILLEGSIEYRNNLFKMPIGVLEGALFADWGNIWKLYSNPNNSGENFELKRFYKEFAVGAGFGLRWNLDYLIFRFDFPVKVIDPSQPVGERFVLDDFKFGRFLDSEKTLYNLYRIPLRIGIGYPF
ncbi:MAG: BamA/TamA family outer membrane protein [Spirosomaceae bacterium]|nr:BamA/TamA family outer membrane protein [Spirosomataceae bacterium]